MPAWMQRFGNWWEAGGWVPLLVLAVALLFIYGGATSLRDRVRFLSLSATAEGQVVDVTSYIDHDPASPNDRKRDTHRWVLTGTYLLDNEPLTFSQTYIGVGPMAKAGDRVSVRYDPGQPTRAELAGVTGGITSPLAILVFGLMMLAVGLTAAAKAGWP